MPNERTDKRIGELEELLLTADGVVRDLTNTTLLPRVARRLSTEAQHVSPDALYILLNSYAKKVWGVPLEHGRHIPEHVVVNEGGELVYLQALAERLETAMHAHEGRLYRMHTFLQRAKGLSKLKPSTESDITPLQELDEESGKLEHE